MTEISVLLCFNIKILHISRTVLIQNIVDLLVEFVLEVIYIIFFSSPGQLEFAKLCRVNKNILKINQFCVRKVGKTCNPLCFSSNGIPRG